jgi:hypothetical protein
MLYRVTLGFLFVVAVVLTLNERRQEQRARDLAERGAAPPPSAVFLQPGALPTPLTGSAAARPALPFLPQRVRVRQEVELREAPEPRALPVQPISRVPPGILAQAVDERNGWYLIDTNLNRGWAPSEYFDDP